MGQAKTLKCKECGYEWLHYEGIGLQGKEVEPKEDGDTIRCPKCNATNIETDDNEHILWD